MDKTWIFIPGIKEKYLSKTKELKTDVLIFDLEDSVVPDDKAEAREMIKQYIKDSEIKAKKFVRVNALNSPFFINDIEELVSTDLDGIVVPKVNSSDDMKIIEYILSHYEREKGLEPQSIKVVPLIETGRGISNAVDIAASIGRIKLMAFGAEDYMLDVNIPEDKYNALLHARSVLVASSSAAGIEPPVDSVYTDFNDERGLQEASKVSRGLGFQGRLIIHPGQLEAVNNLFSPTDGELEEAKKIVEAYESSFDDGSGALEVDGKMIDAPVAERAKKLLRM